MQNLGRGFRQVRVLLLEDSFKLLGKLLCTAGMTQTRFLPEALSSPIELSKKLVERGNDPAGGRTRTQSF